MRRRRSAACQPRSWRANGRMQADVLPEPIAPQISMPVYRPRSGIGSQPGSAASRSATGWCCSPTTTAGAASVRETGHGGSTPAAGRRRWPGSHTRPTETATDHAPDDGQRGREVVPGPDRGVEARRVHRDQVGDRVGAGRRERPPDPDGARGGGPGQQARHGRTLVERHVRPLVIAGAAGPVRAAAADRSRILPSAPLMPP